MWTLLLISSSLLLGWLLTISIHAHRETYRLHQDWLEQKLSRFALYHTWDEHQLKKMTAEHNRQVAAHHAKSMN